MSMKGGSPECECPRQMGSALREPSVFPVSPPLPTPDMNNLTSPLSLGDIICKIMVNQANCTNHTFGSQVIHIIHSIPQENC